MKQIEKSPVDVQRIEQGNSAYPAVLLNRLGNAAPCYLFAMGDVAILRNPLLGLVCSIRCPGGIVIQTFDAGMAIDSPFSRFSERVPPSEGTKAGLVRQGDFIENPNPVDTQDPFLYTLMAYRNSHNKITVSDLAARRGVFINGMRDCIPLASAFNLVRRTGLSEGGF